MRPAGFQLYSMFDFNNYRITDYIIICTNYKEKNTTRSPSEPAANDTKSKHHNILREIYQYISKEEVEGRSNRLDVILYNEYSHSPTP